MSYLMLTTPIFNQQMKSVPWQIIDLQEHRTFWQWVQIIFLKLFKNGHLGYMYTEWRGKLTLPHIGYPHLRLKQTCFQLKVKETIVEVTLAVRTLQLPLDS